MANNTSKGIRGKKLAKAALAKSNTVQADLSGISGETVAKLSSLSQSLGVTYDGNNNVDNNSTNNRLDALESSVGTTVITANANYTVVSGDGIILASNSAIITLPSPVSGVQVKIKKLDATDKIVIATPLSETIDGEDEIWISTQYESITVVTDGTNWYIV